MRHLSALGLILTLAASSMLAACKPSSNQELARDEALAEFPRAFRSVSKVAGTEFSTEAKRDAKGEAELVMNWAGIDKGTTVADIGAGEGYYTVRLAKRVGDKGRVLAQDINRGAIDRLGERITRERWDNVAIIEGGLYDPRLPKNSFDRIFMVHMYHEVTEPYAFLWNLRPALKEGGQVIVVDRDLPPEKHGIHPKLLFCEFEALGFHLKDFSERKKVGAYFARFEATEKMPEPSDIKPCDAEGNVKE